VVHSALDARTKDRMESLAKKIEDRADKDLADIRGRLAELQQELEKLIADKPPTTGDLFEPGRTVDDERRVQRAVELRLAKLPEEQRAEEAAIHRRYSEPVHRMFPVAVSVLLPPGGA
jgi:septal ring factor EnvC (AmiA/AmiB activator)